MPREERLVAFAPPFQGLEFAGYIHLPVGIVETDIQRDHPDGVAGDQELVPFHVVERERENPTEFLQEIRPPVTVESQDDLAVTACPELIFPGIAPAELLMVVDLAVHGQNQLSVRRNQGLSTRLRIHDTQAFVAQHGAASAPYTAPVRSAVTELATHLQGLPAQGVRLLPDIENTDYSTHRLYCLFLLEIPDHARNKYKRLKRNDGCTPIERYRYGCSVKPITKKASRLYGLAATCAKTGMEKLSVMAISFDAVSERLTSANFSVP